MWRWNSRIHQFITFEALVKCRSTLQNMIKLHQYQFRNLELRKHFINLIDLNMYNKFIKYSSGMIS